MKLLFVSGAVVFLSLCVLSENASALHSRSALFPTRQETYLGAYTNFQDRFRTFTARFTGAFRELFRDINLSNFMDKMRRFNDQIREAFRDLITP